MDGAEPQPAAVAIEQAFHDRVKQIEHEFLDYLADEAGQAYDPGDSLTIRDVDEVHRLLHNEGFQPTPPDGRFADEDGWVEWYLPPATISELMDGSDMEWVNRNLTDPGVENLPNGYEVRSAPSLMEHGVGFCIHTAATIPNRLFDARRPWLVESPEGVVRIELGHE